VIRNLWWVGRYHTLTVVVCDSEARLRSMAWRIQMLLSPRCSERAERRMRDWYADSVITSISDPARFRRSLRNRHPRPARHKGVNHGEEVASATTVGQAARGRCWHTSRRGGSRRGPFAHLGTLPTRATIGSGAPSPPLPPTHIRCPGTPPHSHLSSRAPMMLHAICQHTSRLFT
jgi:hypothetical protein